MADINTKLVYETIIKGSQATISQLNSIKGSIQNIDSVGKQVTKSLLGIGAVMVVFNTVKSQVSSVVSAFTGFEDQLADVRRTTGTSALEVKQLGDSLLAYSKTTRTSINDLLQIAQIGGNLGIQKDQIDEFTKSIDKVNVVLKSEFSGGVEEVTNSLAKLRIIFKDMQTGSIADDISRLGNALVVAGQSGAATGEVVADFAQRIGGVGARLGYTAGEVLGLSTAMQELAIEPERGASAFTQILQKMGGSLGDFAKVAGMSVAKFKNLYNSDINGAFLAVAEGINKLGTNNTKLIDTLDKLGIDGIRTSEVMSKLGSNIDRVKFLQNELNKATQNSTQVNDQFAVKNATTAAGIEKLSKSLNALRVHLGEAMSGPLNAAAGALAKLIDVIDDAVVNFNKYIQTSESFRIAVVVLAGVLGGLLLGALAALLPVLASVAVALAPFIIGGAIAGAVVAGVLYMIAHWKEFTDFLENTAGAILQYVSDKFQALKTFLSNKLTEIEQWARDKNTAIKNFFINTWDAIKSAPGNALEAAKKFIKDKLDAIAKFFGDSMTNIRKALDDKVGDVKDFFVNLPSRISDWIASTPGILYQSGKKMMMNFIDGITVWNPQLNIASHNAAQTVADYLEMHSPAKKGPLSTVDKWFPNMGKMLVNDLYTIGKNFVAPLVAIGTTVKNYISTGTFSGISKSMKTLASDVEVAAKQTVKSSDVLFTSLEGEFAAFQSQVDALPQELANSFTGAYQAFKSFRDSTKDTLLQLSKDFDSSMGDIAKTIAEKNAAIADLTAKNNEDISNANTKLVDEYVKQGENILSIKKDIASKQKEIDQAAADYATFLTKKAFDSQIGALESQKTDLEGQIKTLTDSLSVGDKESQKEKDQEDIAKKRRDLQLQMNELNLRISDARLKTVDTKDDDAVLRAKYQMNALLNQKEDLQQQMADFEVQVSKDAQRQITVDQLDELKNRKDTLESQIAKITADNNAAIAIKQSEIDQQQLDEKKSTLADELSTLEKNLSDQQKAYKSAYSTISSLADSLSAAKSRARNVDFANFMLSWNEEQTKNQAAYQTKLQQLNNEINDAVAQRTVIGSVYEESQKQIEQSFINAQDTYLSSLNTQTAGTKYYTDLMSSYFDNVSNKIKDMAKAVNNNDSLANIAGSDLVLNSKGQLAKVGSQSDTYAIPTMQGYAQSANNDLYGSISSVGAGTTKTAQPKALTINAIVDTFVGTEQWLTNALSKVVGQVKKNIGF